VSAFGPVPETLPQVIVHFTKHVRCRHMAVIIRPSPNNRVEHTDQVFLTQSTAPVDRPAHFFQEATRVLPGGLDQQLAVPFAQGLTEEVEPLVDVGDAGLFGRKLQASLTKELFHQRPDFIFQQLFRAAGNDKVIGVSHQIHLGAGVLLRELFPEKFLQPIQGQVRQGWGNDSPDTLDNSAG